MSNQKLLDNIAKTDKIVICFDIDGVIWDLSFINDRIIRPNIDTIKIINKLYDEGNHIILYTARQLIPKEETIKDLKKVGVKYNELHYGKPKAHLYVDDLAVNVIDYIKNPTSYNKKYKK